MKSCRRSSESCVLTSHLQVAHGDIKSENIVVTSWNWVFLTDFSTAFKPAYLPEDDPADFSYFFDTSSRRSCYLAPERFFPAERDTEGLDKAKVTQSMDVFSVGCVIGELFMEGNSPFTLSQMFNYKAGDFDIEPYLRGIEDEAIRVRLLELVVVHHNVAMIELRWFVSDNGH